jgi:hypothetical protein
MIKLNLALELSVLLLLVFYPLLEGLREYFFYQVNRAAGFKLKAVDSNRKTVNVLLWVLACALPVLCFSGGSWVLLGLLALASAFWRWVALDGVLNLKRGLGFWYAGNSGRAFTDKLLYPLSIPARAVLKLLPLIVLISLIVFIKTGYL